LSEAEMISSQREEAYRTKIYDILQGVTEKTEVLVQLRKANTGHYGLKCIATLKNKDGNYTVTYLRQFEDESVES